MELSDFFNSINKTKKNIMTEETSERHYVPFVMNRSFSYHQDCIFHANMMNRYPGLDKKIQYVYYLETLKKASRYAKWQKPTETRVESVMAYYGYSRQRAMEVLPILTDSHLETIQEHLNTGGKS